MRLHRRIVICVAIATGLVSAAYAVELDWSDCVVPAFGADKGKALAACEAVLARSDISDANRERALITGGRAAHTAISLGGIQTILRAQVLLRRSGFSDIPLDGHDSPALRRALTACFGLDACFQGIMKSI